MFLFVCLVLFFKDLNTFLGKNCTGATQSMLLFLKAFPEAVVVMAAALTP